MGRSLHLSAITAAALWALPAVVFSATATAAATVTTAAAGVAKTAEEVIARNAAARGGLEAWRHVERVVLEFAVLHPLQDDAITTRQERVLGDCHTLDTMHLVSVTVPEHDVARVAECPFAHNFSPCQKSPNATW